MTDTSKQEDDGRIRIWVNSGAKMSRGKYAAAAVHAAMTAAGVHPGVPVIVLGGQRDQIEHMRTVIHDAGRTEVEPGTATAGTEYVFEQAHTPTAHECTWACWVDRYGQDHHTPTDDEREAARAYADAVYPELRLAPENEDRADIAERAFLAGSRFRRTAVQEPSAAPTVRDHVRDLTGATDAELDELGGFQGEPSDEYVTILASEFEREWNDRVVEFDPDVHDASGFIWEIMRAALRAAYEEGKKR